MDLADALQKLENLRQSGGLTDDEYAQAKAKLLAQRQAAPASGPDELEQRTRQWAMFIHLSVFAGKFVPLGGFILPIVLWQTKKNELPGIDAHGKNVTNWIISLLLYSTVAVALTLFFCIGFPLLFVLGPIAIIFPIVGALKANEGQIWKYPLTIPFFR